MLDPIPLKASAGLSDKMGRTNQTDITLITETKSSILNLKFFCFKTDTNYLMYSKYHVLG
jgi:hypothetical protein